MIHRVHERRPSYNNNAAVANSATFTTAKVMYDLALLPVCVSRAVAHAAWLRRAVRKQGTACRCVTCTHMVAVFNPQILPLLRGAVLVRRTVRGRRDGELQLDEGPHRLAVVVKGPLC